jgi:UDP-glucose 4-epimerase
MLQGKKVLVTGGAGFIGSHIVESLVKAGAGVKVYDNFSTGLLENLDVVKKDVEIIRGDILDYELLEKEIKGTEIVSHQAAQLEITKCVDDPVEDLNSNTVGTINVLNAAVKNNVSKIINASSACIYGQAQYVPEDEDKHPTNPNWAYGVSKLAGEKYGQIYAQLYRIPVVSLRYAIIYGAREWYGRVLTIFLKRALEDKPLVVFGQGDQERDFTFVEDLVKLHNLCVEKEEAENQVFNVSTGIATSIQKLAETITSCIDTNSKIIHEEVKEGQRSKIVDGRMRLPLELKQMVLDPSKAKSFLNWETKTNLADGIKKEYQWLKENSNRWVEMSY